MAQEQVWLFAADGSWAMVDDEAVQVEQHGPRMLWDEIENAYGQWLDAGSPNRDRFGLTVDRTGEHRYWLDTPEAHHLVSPQR